MARYEIMIELSKEEGSGHCRPSWEKAAVHHLVRHLLVMSVIVNFACKQHRRPTIVPELVIHVPALLILRANVRTSQSIHVRRKHIKLLADIHVAAAETRALRLDLVRSVTRTPPHADDVARITGTIRDLARLDVLADFVATADPAGNTTASRPAESGALDCSRSDLAGWVLVAVEWVGELFV